jgi:uncharacterized protein
MHKRFTHWLHANTPSRESLQNSRFLKPVAHRVLAPELWRFTRRSVPRGVALGLLVGIFLMIPGLQIVGAAMLALPFRANVPLAVTMTFLSNPATTPLILWASVYVGNLTLHTKADLSRFMIMIHEHASFSEWVGWLFSQAAPALLFGLAVIAIVFAAVGYVASVWLWRAHLARKWRTRKAKAALSQRDNAAAA